MQRLHLLVQVAKVVPKLVGPGKLTASLVPLEVLAQIENRLKTAGVQCCPEYEKKQTILLRAFQTFDQAGRGTIPLDAFRKALACFQIETSEAEARALFTKYGQTLKGQVRVIVRVRV